MKETFGTLPNGEQATLYTISCGSLRAAVTDYGATLVRLYVPDRSGKLADVVLGLSEAADYAASDACLGSTVGRNANRMKNAQFDLWGKTVQLPRNEGNNNLHSGPDGFHYRLWQVENHQKNAITLRMDSPNGDQGFPGNAVIRVTYTLSENALSVCYNAVADQDTVFNMTNHSYFNMAGHENTAAAMEQILTLPGRFYTVADEQSIPTGELRNVEGTPMDFRIPCAIGQRINEDYDSLKLQAGYDHNWEAFCDPCCILSDPVSGRTLAISTDCPGIQVYAGNYLNLQGKDGVFYHKRSGVALETQFFPDSVNHPEWKQPFVKAGIPYKSETIYTFSW